MSKSTDRITDAQSAILETAQSVGVRALEGAVELLQLNLQAAQLAASGAPEAARSASNGRQNGGNGAGQLDPSLAFAYQRRAMDIVVRANADIAPLIAQQFRQMQAFYSEATTAALNNASQAGGPFSAFMRGPLEAVQQTMEQTSEAMARAATSAAQAVGSAVNDTEEAPARARRAA